MASALSNGKANHSNIKVLLTERTDVYKKETKKQHKNKKGFNKVDLSHVMTCIILKKLSIDSF